MIEEEEKVNHSTIMNFMKAPVMEIFGGTKETIVKFMIIWYHNGKFYFDTPVEISVKTIYKVTKMSNKGDLVPIGIKEGLVEILTRTSTGKNSKGLIIRQIQATTPKIVAKIMSIGLIVTIHGYELNLDMLEVVDCIEII